MFRILFTEIVFRIFFSLVLTLGLTWILYPAWLSAAAERIQWEEKEPSNRSQKSCKVLLSLVIPAYNEEDRITSMMRCSHQFLMESQKGKDVLKKLKECAKLAGYEEVGAEGIEWIVINDGSTDKTCSVVEDIYESFGPHDTCRLLSLRKNSGKGAAIKTGMSVATGLFRLMVDADGATDFGSGLQNLVTAMHNNMEGSKQTDNINISMFGSRAHLQEESTTRRSLIRTFLMRAFHFFVTLLVSSNIRDTQCGFKLFTKDAALAIFDNLRLQKWAFDTEIVILAEYQQINIIEVPVPWEEIDGSKLNTSKFALAIVSITMLRDMICVRACYTIGLWQVSGKN